MWHDHFLSVYYSITKLLKAYCLFSPSFQHWARHASVDYTMQGVNTISLIIRIYNMEPSELLCSPIPPCISFFTTHFGTNFLEIKLGIKYVAKLFEFQWEPGPPILAPQSLLNCCYNTLFSRVHTSVWIKLIHLWTGVTQTNTRTDTHKSASNMCMLLTVIWKIWTISLLLTKWSTVEKAQSPGSSLFMFCGKRFITNNEFPKSLCILIGEEWLSSGYTSHEL